MDHFYDIHESLNAKLAAFESNLEQELSLYMYIVVYKVFSIFFI